MILSSFGFAFCGLAYIVPDSDPRILLRLRLCLLGLPQDVVNFFCIHVACLANKPVYGEDLPELECFCERWVSLQVLYDYRVIEL